MAARFRAANLGGGGRAMKLLSVLLGFLMLTGSANAIDAVAAFDDPEMQARY